MKSLYALILPALALPAQIEQANLTGVVTGESGAAVVLTNRAAKVKAETETNSAGLYRLPFLSAGEYDLTVTQTGFDASRVTAIRISRSQPIGERMNIQFRAELFNAFNTPQFGAPRGSVTATNFGAITDASNSRVIQLGLRISF